MPKLSITALLLWMLLCAATYAFAREDLVFEFSYFDAVLEHAKAVPSSFAD